MIFDEKDIITTDGYLSFCEENNISYVKTDFFYVGKFNWRGKEHPEKELKDSCVIGHSDFSVTENISNRFKYVFCINKDSNKENTFGIPLGIGNDTDESPFHRICGNKKVILDIISQASNKENLVYLNFTTSTHPSERNLVYDHFHKFPWVTVGKAEVSIQGHERYLKEIKVSKFVLCPRGNGIDTHRLWESLYMGSIPIVKYENAHHLFTDLPILFINNWNEINEEFLNRKYIEISEKEWNFEKLKLSYWTNFIKNKIYAND